MEAMWNEKKKYMFKYKDIHYSTIYKSQKEINSCNQSWNIGLGKKFIWVFPQYAIETSEWHFWQAQYN